MQDWADAEAVERVEVDEDKVASLPLRRGRVETELAERIEAIEAQVAILDAERTALETEFVTQVEGIEAQVESLDIEREWLEAGLSVAALRRAPLSAFEHTRDTPRATRR